MAAYSQCVHGKSPESFATCVHTGLCTLVWRNYNHFAKRLPGSYTVFRCSTEARRPAKSLCQTIVTYWQHRARLLRHTLKVKVIAQSESFDSPSGRERSLANVSVGSRHRGVLPWCTQGFSYNLRLFHAIKIILYFMIVTTVLKAYLCWDRTEIQLFIEVQCCIASWHNTGSCVLFNLYTKCNSLVLLHNPGQTQNKLMELTLPRHTRWFLKP